MAVTDDYLRKIYPGLFGGDTTQQPNQLNVNPPALTLPAIPFFNLKGLSQLPQTSQAAQGPQTSQIAPGSPAEQALKPDVSAAPDAKKPDAFDFMNQIFSGGGAGGAASINPFHTQGSPQGKQVMATAAKSMMGK